MLRDVGYKLQTHQWCLSFTRATKLRVMGHDQNSCTQKAIDYLSAKATIYSKTDREGRWIYQQINAHTVQRLRATLKIDTPSRIELHFKPQLGTITTPPKAP